MDQNISSNANQYQSPDKFGSPAEYRSETFSHSETNHRNKKCNPANNDYCFQNVYLQESKTNTYDECINAGGNGKT